MKPLSFLALLIFVSFSFMLHGQDGSAIFKKNCAVCHTVGKGKLVGPDLKGMDKKHEMKWLISWVKSSQAMVKKNDPKAVALFNENNKMVMPDQALSEEEIKSITAFVGEESAKLDQPVVSAPPAAAPVQVTAPQSSPGSATGGGIGQQTIIYILLGMVIFLTMVLFALARVIRSLSAAQKA